MSSVKILLWKHYEKSDGTCPLVLRITKDRKTRYVFTGEYIHEKHWTNEERLVKKSHPNSTRLNNLLLKKLSEAHGTILEADANNHELSTKQLQKKVKGKNKPQSFFDVANARIQNKKKAKVFSVARAEQSIVNNLRKFTKQENLQFTDITTSFINKYKAYCSSELGQKKRTITNQLIFIRTLYNLAIKDGIVDQKYYPFAGNNEKLRITPGNKIGLTKKEVGLIEELELQEGTSMWHTRNVWLFSFYFAGIRISDVLELRWSDFVDSRLYYEMNKNDKSISLKIPEKAIEILRSYEKEKESNADYVFPFLKKANPRSPEDLFIKARNASRLFNKYLKRIAAECDIDKNLSNHISRHSFGNIAGDKIHPLMLQKLYRHTDLKTTIGYQSNFIHRDADEALDSVING